MSPHSKIAAPLSSSDTVTVSKKKGGALESVETPKSYPDWRIEELGRKYADDEYEDRHERSFYHPYG